MKSLKKLFIVIILTITGLICLLLLIIMGSIYYNNNLSPVAKLKGKIYLGQTYEDVAALFDEHKEQYKNDQNIYFSNGLTKKRWPKRSELPTGKYTHLYQWCLMDDLQLTVYFDKNNKVSHVDFISD